MKENFRYKWATPGDINAFFGLMLDNVMNMVVLAGILIYVFGFKGEFVYTKMIPGTALGVMFGDIIYTRMAFKLAKKEGRQDVTAMPLGLDAPSTIGMAFAVIGPAFMAAKSTMNIDDAQMLAWQIGMATMILIGSFKLIMSFFGSAIQKLVPKAGLLGSLAGIGIALLGCLQLGDIFREPIIGMLSLGLIFYAIVAKIKLPFNLPGVLMSVVAGTALFYILKAAGWLHNPPSTETAQFYLAFPVPTLGFLSGMEQAFTHYLPMAIPFAILTVVGGINVNESARLAGDNYNTRSILLTEAIATLIAGICGGVSQSTPYIGQPAYKAMGGRAAYTLATGLFVGFGGIFGYIPFMAQILPIYALAPILIFVSFDITEQSFHQTPKRHAAAVCFAIFPSVAQLILIILDQTDFHLLGAALDPLAVADATKHSPEFTEKLGVFVTLAHGFILTGMLWGAFLAFILDRKLMSAVATLIICGILSCFGLIHSILPTGGIYLPWSHELGLSTFHYQWAAAYGLLAAVLWMLSFTKGAREFRAIE